MTCESPHHGHACGEASTSASNSPSIPISGGGGGGGGGTIYLETFGCQMNELDSELVHSQLSALGYRFTADSAAASIILYNTCSVREQAENKVFSRVGIHAVEKQEGRNVVLGILGCLAEREGEAMMRRHPSIDLLCGPGELDRLPMLLDNALKTEQVHAADRIALQGSTTRRSSTLSAVDDDLELLDLSRAFDPDRRHLNGASPSGRRSAYVRITRGCNKFCTYCVVPYTRGAEVHRPPDSIIEECRRLADAGVIEITLLGQTVNHYVYVHGAAVTVNGSEAPQIGPGLKAFRDPHRMYAKGQRVTTFAELLRRIHDEVPAIQRLRFVTSYPRDFTDDALQVMAESPRICRYLHVPAQSGSNRILKQMNRGYTVEEYLEFIERARSFMPDVSIAGDIIVGFPTETDDDFEATKELLRRVRFKNNFIFKYSPRPGTIAIDRFADDVPFEVKRRRNNELLALQGELSEAVHREHIGRIEHVFVEGLSQLQSQVGKARGGDGRATGSSGTVELRWQGNDAVAHGTGEDDRAAPPRIQMSGRTGGDLIAVFDLPAESASSTSTAPEMSFETTDSAREGEAIERVIHNLSRSMIGRVIPVRITGAKPLLLFGELAEGWEAEISRSCQGSDHAAAAAQSPFLGNQRPSAIEVA